MASFFRQAQTAGSRIDRTAYQFGGLTAVLPLSPDQQTADQFDQCVGALKQRDQTTFQSGIGLSIKRIVSSSHHRLLDGVLGRLGM